jgi:hypothetical protein
MNSSSIIDLFSRTELFARADRLRVCSILRFAALGFPTTRQEEWRYTNSVNA